MYTEKVIDHFTNPRNVGTIPDASGVGLMRNPADNDTVLITLKIDNDIIADIKFKTMGCGAAIACSSMASEMVKGKTVEEAYKISQKEVAEALGGIPEYKLLCSNLAPDAIKKAIDDWRARQAAKQGAGSPE